MRDIFMLVLFLYISIRYGMGGEISRIPGDWLSQTKHPWAYYFVQPRGNFGVRYHLKPPQNLRVSKGRKLCLPTSNFCLRFFTVYKKIRKE